jgi:hypothetical protein
MTDQQRAEVHLRFEIDCDFLMRCIPRLTQSASETRSAGTATSQARVIIRGCLALTSLSLSLRRPQTMTSLPPRANRSAIASPIPEVPR